MKLIKLFFLFKKCLGEARWNSKYKSFSDKKEIFKILFRLRYLTEISPSQDKNPVQNIFNYKVSGTSYKELLYLFREIFMNYEYDFKHNSSSPKILDCGANIGMAILFFKKLYPNCSILAFEPNPVVFNLLKQNVTQNNIQNVEIINAGVSAEDGEMDFFINRSNSLVSSINSTRGGEECIKVKTLKLSSEVLKRQFDFAKIDIEGAEMNVINDLYKANALGKINQYMIEYHHNIKRDDGLNFSDFLIPFEKSGYESNIRTDYQNVGDFQDISICFSKR